MIFKVSSLRKTFLYLIQGPKFYKDSGQSTSTVTQATIPEELKPYYDTMLKGIEKSLYDYAIDPETGEPTNEVTGVKAYNPYGSKYDANGKEIAGSYDPSKGVAGWSPMQVQAYNSAQNLTTNEDFHNAQVLTTDSGQNLFRTGETALGYGAQGAAIGAQGQAIGAQGANIGAQGAANAATQGGAQIDQAGQYGSNASNIGAQGAANAATQGGAQINQAGQYGAQGARFGSSAAGMAGQGYNAQANFAKQITDPGTSAAYMSPYMQNVVNQQIGATNRQYDITGAQQMGQATKANAFGGSREALMAAENERNRNTEISGIQAKGLQDAFTEGRGQQQFGANLGIQGLGAGVNASQAGIQGAQAGIQGVGAQTAASNMVLQGAQTGIQGQQAAIQGVGAQTAASNMVLQGNQQALAGNAQALQGNQQNLAGINTALQGVQGAQAGYMGGVSAGTALGNLGAQELAAQQSIINTQADIGGQARSREQSILDQGMLDYANRESNELNKLGIMSDILHGVSTGGRAQETRNAQASGVNQAIGALGTVGSLYGALKANGGVIEDRGYANGGVVGYKVGGDVEESMRNKLEDLDNPRLISIIKANESPEMTKIAKEVMRSNYAKGGIVAFSGENGSHVSYSPKQKEKEERKQAAADAVAEQKLAVSKAGSQGGIASAETVPVIAPLPVPPAGTFQPLPSKEAGIGPINTDADVTPLKFLTDVTAGQKTAPVDYAAQNKEENKGTDAEAAEIRATRMKELMDERANAPDEKRRQFGFRAAEFFSNWGTTAGEPLVAGMKAMKDIIPSLEADKKDQKAMMKTVNQSIAELRLSELAEQKGDTKEGTRRRERAADIAQHNTDMFIKYGMGASMQAQDIGAKQNLQDTDTQSKERIATQGNLTEITKAQIASASDLATTLSNSNAKRSEAERKTLADAQKLLSTPFPNEGTPEQKLQYSKAYNVAIQAVKRMADKEGFAYETAEESAAKPAKPAKPAATQTPQQILNSKRLQYYKDHGLTPPEEEEEEEEVTGRVQ
jgi:hypothetical protein